MKWPVQTSGLVYSINRFNSGTKAKIAILLFLGAAHVLLTAFYVVPGHLLIDEIIYHWSSRDLAASGGLSIWNGYEEFPSPELVHPFLSVHSGKLYSQYPAIYTVLASPFYEMSGYYGLFILNSIAFVIVVVLCFATARRLFADIDLALNACLIFALATFAWEYSQAAWPHMIATCFLMGSFYLFVCAYESALNRRATLAAAASGLLAGLGPGLRLDAIYLIPALVLPLMLSRRPRCAELTAFTAGTIPGLTICATLNLLKFGVFSPCVSGHGSQLSGYILAYPAIIIPLGWFLNWWKITDFGLKHKGQLMAGMIVILLVMVQIPPIGKLAKELSHYAYVNVIDIRQFDQEIIRPAMSRSEGGSVVYFGALKKALLQSLPFLALLVVPVAHLFRKENDSGKLLLLLLPPSIYIVGYSYTFVRVSTYEGGLCLNLRYFVAVLPLLSILCSYAIRNLHEKYGVLFSPAVMVISGLVTLGLYLLLVERLRSSVDYLVFPLLVLPLSLVGLLSCAILLRVWKPEGMVRLDSALAVLVSVALAWSGLVAFGYDYPFHRGLRAINYRTSESVLKFIPRDSLFFTPSYLDPFMGLIEQPQVRMAFPEYDGFRDFSRLLEFHLLSGKRCFAAFPERIWEALRVGPLADHEITPMLRGSGLLLAEISLAKRGPRPLEPH